MPNQKLNQFTSPNFYEKYATQTKELNEKLEIAKTNVQSLYNRWEELEQIKSSSQ